MLSASASLVFEGMGKANDGITHVGNSGAGVAGSGFEGHRRLLHLYGDGHLQSGSHNVVVVRLSCWGAACAAALAPNPGHYQRLPAHTVRGLPLTRPPPLMAAKQALVQTFFDRCHMVIGPGLLPSPKGRTCPVCCQFRHPASRNRNPIRGLAEESSRHQPCTYRWTCLALRVQDATTHLPCTRGRVCSRTLINGQRSSILARLHNKGS